MDPSSTAESEYWLTVVRPGLNSVSVMAIKRSLGLFTLFLVSESHTFPGKVKD
jgi:hypothetical protein